MPRADQEGKLLYLDDDMKTEALPSTNVIKAIVTAEDEMDLEKKTNKAIRDCLFAEYWHLEMVH